MFTRSRAIILTLSVTAVCLGTLGVVKKLQLRTPGPGLLFNGWALSPAGEHLQVGDMPLKLIASPDGKQLITTTIGFAGVHLTSIDAATHKQIQSIELEKVWNGLAFSPSGKTLYVGGGNSGKLIAFGYDDGKFTKKKEVKGAEYTFVSGIAVHPVTGPVYACNESFNQIYVLEAETLAFKAAIGTGSNPHSCVFGEDKRHLYVSNWGSSSLTVIDTKTNAHLKDIRVGVRPNDMAVAPDGRLFVACAGDNSVHVVQTRAPEVSATGPTRATRPPEGVREVLNTAIESTLLEGSTPDGVSISPNGKKLYVANADNNNVMVADISDTASTKIEGFIPTGWYPTSVVATDSNLFVTVGKGLHGRANAPAKGSKPDTGRQGQKFDYIGDTLEGYVSFVPVGDPKALKDWTAQVHKNTPFKIDNIRSTAHASRQHLLQRRSQLRRPQLVRRGHGDRRNAAAVDLGLLRSRRHHQR